MAGVAELADAAGETFAGRSRVGRLFLWSHGNVCFQGHPEKPGISGGAFAGRDGVIVRLFGPVIKLLKEKLGRKE